MFTVTSRSWQMPPNDRYPDAPHGIDTAAEGDKFQEFVRGLLNPWGVTIWNFQDKQQQFTIGENAQGCEIKLDAGCVKYGHLSIEIGEKTKLTNWEWVPSGILRQDNSWLYVQGCYEIVFVFAKNWLLRWYKEKVVEDDIHEWRTVKKFYIPIRTAKIMAALVLDGNGKRIWP